MTERCVACGKFIPYSQMGEGGKAVFHFIPDNHFGPEVSEWTCEPCVMKDDRLRSWAQQVHHA